MSNILIIVKMEKFKEQPSNNRIQFLNFLSFKKNIKILNDNSKTTLKKWLASTKKRVNWEPNIIIYYFLSRHEMWITIDIPDFNKPIKNVKKWMLFEDHHYQDVVIPLFKKYNFEKLIKLSKHPESEKIYKQNNIPFKTWGFYFNTKDFYNRNLPKKYDILLYGFVNNAYPLRLKMFKTLKLLLNNKSYIKIKIIEHPGYYKNNYNKLPRNAELSEIIGQSRFTLVSSSAWRLLLKKYYEVPMSGSTIIGDIPPHYKNELKDKIIELDFDSDEQKIYNVLVAAINNKFSEIEKISLEWGKQLYQINNFDKGYDKLYDICNN